MLSGVIAAVILLLACLTCVELEDTMEISGSCDFSDLDLNGMVNTIVNRLPQEYSLQHRQPQEVLPGLFLGSINYTGWNDLRPYGAVHGFCHKGQKFAQVDLATTSGRLKAVMPWMICARKNGTVEGYAKARVTVVFKVVEPALDQRSNSAAGSKLVYELQPELVSLDDMYPRLTGAGEILETAATVLGKLLPQFQQDFWFHTVTWRLGNILHDISSE